MLRPPYGGSEWSLARGGLGGQADVAGDQRRGGERRDADLEGELCRDLRDEERGGEVDAAGGDCVLEPLEVAVGAGDRQPLLQLEAELCCEQRRVLVVDRCPLRWVRIFEAAH